MYLNTSGISIVCTTSRSGLKISMPEGRGRWVDRSNNILYIFFFLEKETGYVNNY